MSDAERASTWWYSSENGGGAFLDIGCYGCFFNEWARDNKNDKPISVMAHAANYNTPFMDAPDNMAGIIEYKNSFGVIEGTWTVPQASLPTGPIYICTDGVLYTNENKATVFMNSLGEKLDLPHFEMHPHIKNLPDHYAYCKRTGEPLIKAVTLDFNIQVMAIIDAAMKSAKNGTKENVHV